MEKKINTKKRILKFIQILIFIIVLLIIISIVNNVQHYNSLNILISKNIKLTNENKEFKNQITELNTYTNELLNYKKIYDNTINVNIEKEPNIKYYDIPLTKSQQEYICMIANQYDISLTFIYGLISLESNFKTDAISYNNTSHGIMQVNKTYANEMAKVAGLNNYNLYNFNDNVQIGIAHLNYLQNYWINKGITSQEDLFYLITLSYNRGISGAKNYIKKHNTMISSYGTIILKYKNNLETKGNI